MFDFSGTIKTDALLLDVDGTLWDSTSIVAKAWNKAARETGFEDLNVEPDFLKGLFGKTMDEIAYALVPGASKEKRDELMDRCVIYEQQALEEDPRTSQISCGGLKLGKTSIGRHTKGRIRGPLTSH